MANVRQEYGAAENCHNVQLKLNLVKSFVDDIEAPTNASMVASMGMDLKTRKEKLPGARRTQRLSGNAIMLELLLLARLLRLLVGLPCLPQHLSLQIQQNLDGGSHNPSLAGIAQKACYKE